VTADQLERRLRDIRVPDSEAALVRAVKEARDEVSSRPAPAAGGLVWRRRALVLAAIALALVIASFTPPGRAASAWVGKLVGIGDVGGPPTLDEPGSSAQGTGVVVANGSAPDGSRYEWVAYRCEVKGETGTGRGFRGLGLSLDWPGLKLHEGGEECEQGSGDQERGAFRSWGVQILPSQSKGVKRPDLVISGYTGQAVHRVSVIYVEPNGRKRELPVRFERVQGKLRRLARRPAPLGTFIAFLPGEIAARDEVEARLDLRVLASTGKLKLGPLARRELAQAAEARQTCESAKPDNATLAKIVREHPVRSEHEARERQKALRRVLGPQLACMKMHMPRGPFEYVAYDANGRVLDRESEPLVLPSTLLPPEPAGREAPGEARLPYPDAAPGSGRPIVLVSSRAPDGALFELYAQRFRGGVCVQLFWPYVFDESAGGYCGSGFLPTAAFGRRNPERVAARGYGSLNDSHAATTQRVMTGFARSNVARVRVVYEDAAGRRHDAPVTLGHLDKSLVRRLGARSSVGVWVTFVPRSAGPRPWLQVVAYAGSGRVLSRERQRG
jgi:hypothetical protein